MNWRGRGRNRLFSDLLYYLDWDVSLGILG